MPSDTTVSDSRLYGLTESKFSLASEELQTGPITDTCRCSALTRNPNQADLLYRMISP
jgi:hypothetical protein